MKKSLFILALIGGACLLNGCGGGTAQPPPPPPAVATHFVVTAPTAANIGSVFSFSVTAIDAEDNLATSYSGTVRFTSTDGKAVLPANAALAGGMGMFSATLETGGSQTITATDMAKTTITGATGPISVTMGASHFHVAAPSTATVGTAFDFTVTALDASYNAYTGYSGTVHFTSTDGLAVLPSNSPLASGTANFSVTLNTIGIQTLTATDVATSSITGISNSIQVFATASGFTATGSMGSSREKHTATLLNNGKVLIAGGDDNKVVLATAELFDPGNQNFTATGTMQTERTAHTATLLTGGKVLIAGGRNGSGSLATAELFDPDTGNFTTTGSMGTGRNMQTATALNDGKVLVAGGEDSNGNALASAELFDPNNRSFTATGSMTTARFGHTATLLNDGKVLIAGGTDPTEPQGESLATAELYDPGTGNFTPTSSMETARSLPTATLLKNGKVLMAGPVQTAELFDPNSGIFAATGGMTTDTERFYHTATLLNNGTVLVAGGESIGYGVLCAGTFPDSTATAELFDPTSGTFAATRDMALMRSSHTATLLPNGDVLVTGGIMWSYAPLPGGVGCPKMTVSVTASAELYK